MSDLDPRVLVLWFLWSAGSVPAPLGAQVNGGNVAEGPGPWHAVESSAPPGADAGLRDLLDRAEAEIHLGRHGRVIALLSDRRLPASESGRRAMRVLAAAYLAEGSARQAAELFARAARSASGRPRGTLVARSGRAWELAGDVPAAIEAYLEAAALLPSIGGWLYLRAAGLYPDPSRALERMSDPPPAAGALVERARADAYLRLGDTVEAIDRLSSINAYREAAALSDSLGHDALTRELLYAAMSRVTERDAVHAADVALERFHPAIWREYDLVARALGRHGRARDAAPILDEWIALGDSSAVVYHLLGVMREAAGDRWGAMRAWERAAAGADPDEAGESEYRRIRLMVRMRRRTAAIAALRRFPLRFPDHDRTARAMYLLGDLMWDAGQRAASDSVFLSLSQHWPEASNTRQARYRLAMRALLRADTALAMERLGAAARSGGESGRSSGYQLGVLLETLGDSAGARSVWSRLARSDSVGYYGMIARRAAGLAPPSFEMVQIPESSGPVRTVLESVGLLDEIRLTDESAALVDHTINSGLYSPEELLAFAEGLVDRGRTVRAIRLGWQLSEHFTLNNARLIRVIFPFPNRKLVERESAKFGLDPYLVAGMIRQESAFDPEAVSRAGARGLMQLMPTTARGTAGSLGVMWSSRFLTVADANVHVGAAHLAALIRQYDGKIEPTLAAYNAGGTPVRRWLRYPEADDPVRWIERVPYAETRGYLKTVLRNRDLYRALYGPTLIP